MEPQYERIQTYVSSEGSDITFYLIAQIGVFEIKIVTYLLIFLKLIKVQINPLYINQKVFGRTNTIFFRNTSHCKSPTFLEK